MEFLSESAPAADTELVVEEQAPGQEASGPGPALADPPGRARLQQLHAYLVHEGTDVPEDYHVFEQKMLEKPERLRQLHDYLVKDATDVPKDYGVFEQKMTEGLPGFGKKKAQSVAGSPNASTPAAPGGEPAGLAEGAPATRVPQLNPAQLKQALGIDPADLPPPAAPAPELESQQPLQRGTGANPAARNLLDLATGAPATQAVGERPAADEQQYLDHLPAHPDPGTTASGRAYEQTPYGQELVQIPNDYTGRVPQGTFALHLAGQGDRTQYFYRPLSDKVDGQAQSVYAAAAGRFKNSLFEMAQGAGEGAQALTNLPGAGYEKASGQPGYHADFGDEFSGYLEGKKTKLADLYTKGVDRHANFNNLLLQSAEYAPLVVAQVAQTLAPELRAPAALQRALGLVSTVGFDAQMVHGAREQAKAAGLTGNSADLYTTLVGGLTLAGFKTGSKLMGALGDKLAQKLAPDELREAVALGAVQRLEQLQTQAGRAASAAETRQALHESLRSALPRLAQVPKEALQQAPVFGAVEAGRLGADQVLAPALGGQAEELTPGAVLARVGDAAKGGLLLGGLTGGVDAALGGLARRSPAPGEAQLPENVVALGATPSGRPLFAELGADGQPAHFFDERGPVDFGAGGPPPAVHQAVGAALARRTQPPAGTPAPPPAPEPTPTGTAPAEASVPTPSALEAGQLYEVRRPTGQVELTRAQLVRVDRPQGRAVVRAVDGQGNPVEREVDLASLVAMGGPAPRPASSEAGAAPAGPAEEAGPIPEPGSGTTAAEPPAATPPAGPVPTYGTPAENRAVGRFEKDGQVYERAAPLGERAARGNQATAEFASGVQQPVHYAVIEAADLQPSHLNGRQNLRHFLPEAQPKNRSAQYDPASQKAIADIAAAPDMGRLSEAPNAYSGAPVVNGRGEALQGNGRAAGIREHYAQGGTSYRHDVILAAERAGIPASETAKFKEPVLVRVADVSDQRARELGNYTAADTESGGKRRLDARQASGKLDERGRADLARLATPQGDATLTETLRANGPELLRLLRRAGAVNETQLQTMVKADGSLTPQGVEDLAGLYRHQLFADGDPNLPELFAELPAAAQSGLDRAGGALLGLPESASLVPEVQQAISGVRELLASGADFATWAGQADAFRGGQAPRERYSPLALRLIELLTTEKRPTAIARYFQEYANAVRGEADSLFGATPPKSREEASQQVFGVVDDRPAVNIPRTDVLNAVQNHNINADQSGIINTAENGIIATSSSSPSTDERPAPETRNAGAAESPAGRDATDQRPSEPESRPAPGPDAAAADATRPRADAGDTESRPAAGIAAPVAEPVTVKVSHTDYVVSQDAADKPVVTNKLHRTPLSDKHPHYRAALNLAREARRPARAPLAAGAVVDTEPTTFRGRADAEAWAREHIQGRQVTNTATGEAISISRSGIDKALSGKAFDKTSYPAVHLAAVRVLPELLESAEPRGGLEPDKRGDHNLLGVQRFGARLRVGGQEYPVKLTVKKLKREGNSFYTHEIEKVEVLPERPVEGQGLQSEIGQADPNTDNTSTSAAKVTPPAEQKLPEAAPAGGGPAPAASPAEELRSLNESLMRASQQGDQGAADELAAQAQRAAEAAAGGPASEPGRGALATRLLAEHAPAVVVHLAEQASTQARAAAEAKLTQQAEAEGKQLRQEKGQALDHALATPAVRAVREEVAGKTAPTTEEQLATVRAERARLLDELRQAGKPSGQAYSTLVPITPQMARSAELHVRIFRTYISEGVVRVRDLVARIRREAGPLLTGVRDEDLTKRATAALDDHRAAVRQGVAELGTTLDKIARDYATSAEQVGATLAQRFTEDAGLAPAEAQRYADAIRREFDQRIAAARQRRLNELKKRAAGPAGKQDAQTQVARVRELFTLSPTDDAAILDHLRRTTDLPGLSEADAARLRQLADAVSAAPTGFQKDEAVGKLLDATAGLKKIDWLEVSHALWYANVLSGYKTHALNLFANTLQTGSEALVHTTHAVLSGRGRFAAASARGLAEGLRRGAREAVSVLTTGRQVSRDGQKFEVPDLLEQVRFAGGAANPVNHLKLVGRALRAGDVLFSTGLKEMRAHELAIKQALAEGQPGEPSAATWARANELLYRTKERLAAARAQAEAEGLRGNDLARRVYELAEQSRPVGLTEEAREYGTRAVFNGEVKGGLGWVTTGIQTITQGIDIAGFKPAKLIVPFTRVVANVANAYLDYTPVGAARAGVSLAREQLGHGSGGHLLGGPVDSKLQRQLTGEEREHLAIKAVLGSSVAAVAYALSHNQDAQGRPTLEITGAGTGDPAKDAQLRADGWQPYSVQTGGKYYSYANHPVGTMLAVIGNLNDGERYRKEHVQDSDDALQALWLNSFRALQFTKDQTALKGAADFLTAADSKSPEQLTRWAQRLAVGTVRGYVPWSALLTQLAKDGERLAGQPKKQAHGFGQALVQDIPVARDHLQNALDVLGDPLPLDTDRILSERPARDAPTRAVWDWLAKNDLFIPTPSRNSGGAMVLRAHQGEETPMSDDEYFRFAQKRGQLLKAALQQQLPELQKLTPAEAKKKLKQQVQRATRAAKQQTFTGQ